MPLLLCDLDDTLVDRKAAFRLWATTLAESHGLGDEFVEWILNEDDDGDRPRGELFSLVRDRLQLSDPVEELSDLYMREFTAGFRCEQPVIAALTAARDAGWSIAIVTNGWWPQTHKIEAAGLGGRVDAVCISGEEDVWKPDPRLLEIAAAHCGCGLEGAWMIGDNPAADIGAAVAAGIDSVWLPYGRDWSISEYRPTAEADTFADAVALVLGHRPVRDSVSGR